MRPLRMVEFRIDEGGKEDEGKGEGRKGEREGGKEGRRKGRDQIDLGELLSLLY
jgi:hypothetical protein